MIQSTQKSFLPRQWPDTFPIRKSGAAPIMKILIAEDDYTTRLMLQVILEKWKYKVVVAENGIEAMKEFERHQLPQIAILDWEMPEMNGLEVCEKIRELELQTPVYIIMLTGRSATQDIVNGLDAGADDYVTKPFDENELRARIRVAERMVRIQESLSNTVEELSEALDQVDTLQGILPICTHCQSLRSDNEAWQRLEKYIESHTMSKLSKSICPDCMEKQYSDGEE